MSEHKGTLLLTRSHLASLLSMEEYIQGIENAFRKHGEGQTYGTDMIHGDTPGELEFHIKAGGLKLGDKRYYGLKINASCFTNMANFGLPNIMGAIILFDAEKGIPLAIIDSIESLEAAAPSSDVLISCTPSKQPFVMKEFITPGTFVAAIGSDSPDKQELETSLLQGTKVVVDIFEQCALAGELHHGLEAGIITKDTVHAEIGQIIAGKKPGRETPDEIIVYDATGTALQDTAAAALCYEKAVEKGIGQFVDFFK